jgi:hypothetical protein
MWHFSVSGLRAPSLLASGSRAPGSPQPGWQTGCPDGSFSAGTRFRRSKPCPLARADVDETIGPAFPKRRYGLSLRSFLRCGFARLSWFVLRPEPSAHAVRHDARRVAAETFKAVREVARR